MYRSQLKLKPQYFCMIYTATEETYVPVWMFKPQQKFEYLINSYLSVTYNFVDRIFNYYLLNYSLSTYDKYCSERFFMKFETTFWNYIYQILLTVYKFLVPVPYYIYNENKYVIWIYQTSQ